MNRKTGKLKVKEKRFCEIYAAGGDVLRAAAGAGFACPETVGAELLSRDEINKEIRELYEKRLQNARQKAYAGYERIAFGSVNDAVRLLFESDAFGEPSGEYDLFNVAEIRRPKEGALEIKFFDRLKALEKLEQYGREDERGTGDFYQALIGGIGKLDHHTGEETV